MNRIVTITVNPAVDKTTAVNALLPDKKLRCTEPVYEPGGGGINVARAISKLGGEATPVYFAGGPEGLRLTALLKQEGITGVPVNTAGVTRENLSITDNATGRQYRFVMPGPAISEKENADLLEVVKEASAQAAYIVVSGSMLKDNALPFFQAIKEIAAKAGARLVVDTSGDALHHAVEAGVYLIKPNIGELAALTGKDHLNETETLAAARKIIHSGGSEVVVISMGAAGAFLVTAESSARIAAPVVKRVSTVGAGDSMVAGMVWALQSGRTVEEAVRYGVACGTAATMNPGTGLCKKQDVEMLLADEMR